MRVFVGGLVAGIVLKIVTGERSLMAYLVAGWLSALLLSWTAPRSYVERVGLLLSVALVAWVAGPRAAFGQSLFWHLVGWTLAASALAYALRPRAE